VRAVIDNNVLVSGLLWGDKPGRVLAAVAEGHVQIFLSEELLAELREVLRRKKFAARLALNELTPETALAKAQAPARLVPASPIPAPPSLRDPDDLAVLACAVSAAVDVIITGDKDLLTLKSFEGIPIIDAAEALKRLGLS
jgi:putative PIN family toxin of toxin-antitoxin system